MFQELCKSCQYCLESLYWKCIEEKFCFDKKIATYKFEDEKPYSNGYTNMGASLDSVVTEQPINNNHLPLHAGREINELPLHADKLYEVFSKSMIFRDDQELKSKSSVDSLDTSPYETKSEPDLSSDKPNRTRVYFEDEVNSPVTDFEIMFKDELLSNYDMFKIVEEEESDRGSPDTEEGLTMNVAIIKQDVMKPTTVTIKDESKFTTQPSVYSYDPMMTVKKPMSLPKNENVRGILRQKNLPRSQSSRTLERAVKERKISRVDSLSNLSPEKMREVLARVPQRSASFLNIPDHLIPEKPPLTKSKSTIGVTSLEEDAKLSRLPDTPIIKSNNLPRFFADSPTVPEYRDVTSLQKIKQQSETMYQQNDFSMPRYYGTVSMSTENLAAVHESKSMPDLRVQAQGEKISKRLIKLRSRLKPLIIKKGTDENV